MWERFAAASTARAATKAYLSDSAAALSGSILDVPTGCMAVLSSVDDDAHRELENFFGMRGLPSSSA